MRHRSESSRSRAGFTLIELLVVIAIIAILVALIMPAVMSARESANRAKCQNNLKQLGLAAQEYHDSFGSFPAGWYCMVPTYDANNNLTSGDINCATVWTPYQNYMWSGLTGLLLKIEQGNLYNEINFQLPVTAADYTTPYPDNATAVRRTMDVLVCPSNRAAQAVQATGTVAKFGPSDYRGNMAAGMAINPNCATPTPSNFNCLVFDNGITYQNSTISFADITDGSSSTVMLGESISSNPADPFSVTLNGVWAEATSCCVRTNVDRTINKPIVVNSSSGTQDYWTYWSSKHPSQVLFGFCDGSVRQVSQQISKLVLNKIMTRAGAETVSADEIK
jgi:prepilin-type N-terminal cleavage/methylation domain-containing protein